MGWQRALFKRALFIGSLLAVGMFITKTGLAITINASTYSLSDVQMAINSAATGDVVMVPPGNTTWATSATIPNSKKITLRGAGMDATIITKNPAGWVINLNQSGSRVTGFQFMDGTIIVDGDGWRIDHCKFDAPSGYREGVLVNPGDTGIHPTGLIDHCNFNNTRICVYGTAAMLAEGDEQHILWAQPLDLGSGNNKVFIEDCTFLFTVFANCVDSNYGARYVFRYNTATDGYIEAHSVQGNNRASRSWEIYNNTILQVNRPIYMPFRLRGGTGVVFNNTVSGTWGYPNIGLDNVRDYDTVTISGKCDGSSAWDGNGAIANGSGTHGGLDNTTTLSDTTKNWSVDALSGQYLYNLTDGSKGLITANTNTTVTAILSGGPENDWDAADNYKITNGYPARDQIGRSTDQWQWSSANPYPPQALDPAYCWNNKLGAADVVFVAINVGTFPHIIGNRDYYNNTPKPGYTPYTYPHPLDVDDASTSTTPKAPMGLRMKE